MERITFFKDIEVFDSNLIKIDKKLYKNIDIYYIGYWTYSRKNGSKYLVFDSTDEKKDVLEKYTELLGWD